MVHSLSSWTVVTLCVSIPASLSSFNTCLLPPGQSGPSQLGRGPSTRMKYLPRKPTWCKYTLAFHNILQGLENSEYLLNKSLNADMTRPFFLSDAARISSEWAPIGWTSSWIIELLGFDDFRCLFLEGDDGRKLTIQLGVKRETCDQGFGVEYFYRGSFNAVESWGTEYKLLAARKGRRATFRSWSITGSRFSARTSTDPTNEGEAHNSELTFVIYIKAHGYASAHSALCDHCSLIIYETRYKCTVCDDFDYCERCFVHAPSNHPWPYSSRSLATLSRGRRERLEKKVTKGRLVLLMADSDSRLEIH